MGIFDGLLRHRRKVTDPEVTAELPRQRQGLTFQVGNVQGIGQRERQEDSFAIVNAANPQKIEQEGLLAVVADGMGGMADGKLASQCAVELLVEQFRQESLSPLWLPSCVHSIGETIFRQFSGASGTTLVAVHIVGRALHWVSVGDSAIFLMRDGGVFRLNQEHTFLNQLYEKELEQEVICRERAEQDEDAHRLTAFVGIDHLKELDFSLRPLPLQSGDVLLLCSDGISGILTAPELMEAMALGSEAGCSLLETLVLEKGLPGQDNYTGILLSCK